MLVFEGRASENLEFSVMIIFIGTESLKNECSMINGCTLWLPHNNS
jgi:hypothetical protein